MGYLSILTTIAKNAQVPLALFWAICSNESRDFTLDYAQYDNGSPSYGVCQVKLGTAQLFGFKGKALELRNAKVSTKYAALYLKYQLQRYNNDWIKATSAYNSGTYSESKKVIGCPRNLRYIHLVQEKLPENLKYKLDCRR